MLSCGVVLTVLLVVFQPQGVYSENPHLLAQEFAGAPACESCHAERDLSTAGYNIWEEAHKSGHAFAATLPGTELPSEIFRDSIPLPPDSPSWNEYAFVLGGYGWKSTYVHQDGSQLTADANAQYNLETNEWIGYHPGESLDFDVECSRCHTTGTSLEGSWNGNPEDSLGTFNELGVRCEGCHGPSSLHATRRFSTSEGEVRVLKERCGDCHNNGSKESPIPVVDKFVVNHAQYQELEASRHGEIGFFTCATCHEPHLALKRPELIGIRCTGRSLEPIRQACQDCHTLTKTNHPAPIACIDCHMASASKSAVGIEYENGGARGDVASHIWRINVTEAPRDSMFTEDGAFLKADATGRPALTLDFACLGCHTESTETLAWAASYAPSIHLASGTPVEDPAQPSARQGIKLQPNYPNPFRSQTTLVYELSEPVEIVLSIYDTRGREVIILDRGLRQAGTHAVTWNGTSSAGAPVASGQYMAQLRTGSVRRHRALHLLR